MDLTDINVFEKDLRDGEVIVGIASSPEEKIGRMQVVTDRYMFQGYLQGIPFVKMDLDARDVVGEGGFSLLEEHLDPEKLEDFMKEGLLISFMNEDPLYIDKYHWQSVQFVGITNQGYVGSVRLIMSNPTSEVPTFKLPTLTDRKIKIEKEWKKAVKHIPAELSQFAKLKSAPGTVSVALLRAAAQYSRANGIEEWVATTDNLVIRLLNGIYFNFGLPKIGPSVCYLGSESTPILINIEESLNNAEQKASSKDTAKFLKGEAVPGFEWYTGI